MITAPAQVGDSASGWLFAGLIKLDAERIDAVAAWTAIVRRSAVTEHDFRGEPSVLGGQVSEERGWKKALQPSANQSPIGDFNVT